MNVRLQVAKVPSVLLADATNVYDKLKHEVYVPKGPERRVSDRPQAGHGRDQPSFTLGAVKSTASKNSLTNQGEHQQLTRFF